MEIYRQYLAALYHGAGYVGCLGVWTGLALLLFALAGFWLPLLRIWPDPERVADEAARRPCFDWVWALPVALAAGMALSLWAWTLSLFATGRLLAGGLVLVLASFAGLGLAWRQRRRLRFRLSRLTAWSIATVFTLLLGLWQHAPTDMPFQREIPRLVYSDLHQDLSIHVYLAALIRDGGLPLNNLWGSPEYAYSDLVHTGHAVLIAGLSATLGIGLYQASVALWILASVLIAWATLALLIRTRMPGWLRWALVLATLVWGAFILPKFYEFREPVMTTLTGREPLIRIAARGFWNISQTLSISLTLAGTLLMDRYAAIRRRGIFGPLMLLAATWFFVTGGWTKPSLVIFYAPGMLLWMLLNRANRREWAAVLGMLAAGVLIYMLPALVARLPEFPGWSPGIVLEQWALVGKFVLLATASLLVLAIEPLRRLLVESWRDRRWRVVDLALLAMGGSLIFALLFHEDRYVGFRSFQPNLWWGPTASIVMLVPLLGREAWGMLGAGGWRRAVAIVGLLMATVHIVNGACFAIAYPILHIRDVALPVAETLDAARSRTAPGTRFAVDPTLRHYEMLAYLSRPVLFESAFTPQDVHQAVVEWEKFCSEGQPPNVPLLERLDAVIVHVNRQHVRAYLAQRGWRGETLNRYFEIWRRPGPEASP